MKVWLVREGEYEDWYPVLFTTREAAVAYERERQRARHRQWCDATTDKIHPDALRSYERTIEKARNTPVEQWVDEQMDEPEEWEVRE